MNFSVDDQFRRAEDHFGNVFVMKREAINLTDKPTWVVKMIPNGFENFKVIGIFVEAAEPCFLMYSTRLNKKNIHDLSKVVMDELLPKNCLIIKYDKEKRMVCTSDIIRKKGSHVSERTSIDMKTGREFTREVYRIDIAYFNQLTEQLSL